MKNDKQTRDITVSAVLTIGIPIIFLLFALFVDYYPKSQIRSLIGPSFSKSENCTFINWGYRWKSKDMSAKIKDFYTNKWNIPFMPLNEIIPIAKEIDYTYYLALEIKTQKSDWNYQKTVYISTIEESHRTMMNINLCNAPSLQITYP